MVPWRQCKYPTSTCLLISYVAILPLKGIMIPVFFFFAPAPISIAGVQAFKAKQLSRRWHLVKHSGAAPDSCTVGSLIH